MTPTITITVLIRTLLTGSLIAALAGCGVIRERLAAEPVKRVTTLGADQACDASVLDTKRLSGAYLRKSDAAGESYLPVLVTGNEKRNGLVNKLTVNEQATSEDVDDTRVTTFKGTKKSGATERKGFGAPGKLPNVYDVTYTAKEITFSGPMVVGPGAFNYEIPTSGGALFSGPIALEVITLDAQGAAQTVRTRGRFALQAGYGSGQASLTATGFDAALPFDTLTWTNLHLCGSRFVSSGKGIVTVKKDGGAAVSPFKAGRDPAAFRAVFESAHFAPLERPNPPTGLGGVFLIQSDNGTMTGVFLSDPAPEATDG